MVGGGEARPPLSRKVYAVVADKEARPCRLAPLILLHSATVIYLRASTPQPSYNNGGDSDKDVCLHRGKFGLAFVDPRGPHCTDHGPPRPRLRGELPAK
ncbi:hypothetical protein E2C01_076828 [Portunus trituberculatus]|uniref:Uncharacterized protein n=1 Tax=Portunus trituberculatus TaxID=210409 RepID=A0A5B7I9R9_PORTR|nr:hypothetical protein [Portunus trituberculatus]